MNFKYIVTSILFSVIAFASWANPIDVQTACEKASRVMSSLDSLGVTTSDNGFSRQTRIAGTVGVLSSSMFGVSSQYAETAEGLVLETSSRSAYVFRNGSGHFVIAAADDRLPEVLAYGDFTGEVMPPQLQTLLRCYDNALQKMPENGFRAHSASTLDPVAPLLTTFRGQGTPYNSLCPYYKYDDGTVSSEPCDVGCVATALEQILTYYRRDYVLQEDLKGWETEHYAIADVPKGSHVDSRLILNDYTGDYTSEQGDAVARLSYWLGMAVHMNWSPGSSGAESCNAKESLMNAFGLKYVVYADSYNYDPSDWVAMIRNEIKCRRPVYYAGSVMRFGGHAFVLDGYDSDGYFHVNWGYDGHYDGYFNLEVLNYSEPKGNESPVGYENGFFCNQEALFICPDDVEVQLPEPIERTGEEILLIDWALLETPVMTSYTPLSVTLKNSSQRSLTTPLEFFTNLDTDEDVFRDGDYVGLTSVTLKPEEERTITVHLRFDADGERIMRMSADDVHYVDMGKVSIEPFHGEDVSIAAPLISFRAGNKLDVAIDVTNKKADHRLGGRVVYELVHEGYEVEGIRHFHYLYASPGETISDSESFYDLVSGDTYRLLIRYPWRVVHEIVFVMPETSGLDEVELNDEERADSSAPWYNIQGKRVAKPNERGIYVRNRKKILVR